MTIYIKRNVVVVEVLMYIIVDLVKRGVLKALSVTCGAIEITAITITVRSSLHAITSIHCRLRLIIADCRGQTNTARTSVTGGGVSAAGERRFTACAFDVA